MKSCGKVLCVILSLLYLGILDTEVVDAAKNAKRSGSKSKSKKSKSKKKSKKRKGARAAVTSKSSVEEDTEEETVAEENTPAQTQAQTPAPETTTSAQTTQTETVTTPTEQQSATPVAPTVVAGQQNSAIESDAQWESFKVCMKSNCGGGDDQPDNVGCYKPVAFDNAFLACKSSLSETNRANFEAYFRDYVIPEEQKKFCLEVHQGVWKDGKCALKVVYKRKKIENECLKDQPACQNIEVEREWFIDEKSHSCNHEEFKVDACYKDGPNCSAAKMKQITGWIGIGSATITGAVSAIGAVQSATIDKETTDSDGKKKIVQTSSVEKGSDDEKELTGKRWGAGVAGALQGAGGGIASGVGALVEADMYMKERGDIVWGACHVSNGDVIQEGASKKLSW